VIQLQDFINVIATTANGTNRSHFTLLPHMMEDAERYCVFTKIGDNGGKKYIYTHIYQLHILLIHIYCYFGKYVFENSMYCILYFGL
jgi:hypothetical protein